MAIEQRGRQLPPDSDFRPWPFGRGARLAVAALAGATLVALGLGGLKPAGAKQSAATAGGGSLAALSTLPVPAPPDLQRFIRDSTAAQKLGKALFWDMQAGSDGRTACATCHYDAGADNRSRNQLNPRGGSFASKGPNAQLTASDFPINSDNVVGSQGVLPSHFTGVDEGEALDGQTLDGLDTDFHVGAVNVRRTTGRNAPSVINAVFNNRNFWDGRAQNEFNGVNPFGTRDPDARVGHVNAGGGVDKVAVTITNSSLASQADGPPGNNVEMSSDGRTLSDIGRKLLSVRPLANQQVSASDSLLGGEADPSGRGLRTSYADLIRQAFQPEWWSSGDRVAAPNGRTYSLTQFNFPMFWGLAIQAYESTLVSDRSPVDRFLSGETAALGSAAQQGMTVFTGKGQCSSCHLGAALTDATVDEVGRRGLATAIADTGFHNLGVRSTATDPGVAGSDPFGHPLSAALLDGGSGDDTGGAFKTPSLRNVALTAPYFHNGGQLSLRQVVDFYSRGGDFANPQKAISDLGLTDAEKDSVVAFLEALTDPRVANAAAPFDHPQLFVPVGAQTRPDGSVITENGRAVDCFKEVPATGSSGDAPLPQFPAFTGPPCDMPPALSAAVAPSPVSAAPKPSTSTVSVTVRPRVRRCVVPNLKRHTLTGVRRMLKRANCRLGSVRRARGRGRLVVRTQRPAAGVRRAAGSRVAVQMRRVKAKRKRKQA